jgi:hypothetical protein
MRNNHRSPPHSFLLWSGFDVPAADGFVLHKLAKNREYAMIRRVLGQMEQVRPALD